MIILIFTNVFTIVYNNINFLFDQERNNNNYNYNE